MTQVLPRTKLRVALATGHEAVAHLSGKRRKHVIWISIRNHVQVAMLSRAPLQGADHISRASPPLVARKRTTKGPLKPPG